MSTVVDLSTLKREDVKVVDDSLDTALAQTIADYEARAGKKLQPAHIERLSAFSQVRPTHHRAVLWITNANVPPALWDAWAERLVVYRPPAGQPADASTATTPTAAGA